MRTWTGTGIWRTRHEPDVHKLLAFSLQKGASDLHLSAGMPPLIRLHGEMTRLDVPAIPEDEMLLMIRS